MTQRPCEIAGSRALAAAGVGRKCLRMPGERQQMRAGRRSSLVCAAASAPRQAQGLPGDGSTEEQHDAPVATDLLVLARPARPHTRATRTLRRRADFRGAGREWRHLHAALG